MVRLKFSAWEGKRFDAVAPTALARGHALGAQAAGAAAGAERPAAPLRPLATAGQESSAGQNNGNAESKCRMIEVSIVAMIAKECSLMRSKMMKFLHVIGSAATKTQEDIFLEV